MIHVSNDYKAAMRERRNFKNYAEITFADGQQMTLDDSQFVASNNSLYDGGDVQSFPLGVAVRKDVQLEIINNAEQYRGFDFLGAKIRLYIDYALVEINPWLSRNLLLGTGESKTTTEGSGAENQVETPYSFADAYISAFPTYDRTVTFSYDYTASEGAAGKFKFQVRLGTSTSGFKYKVLIDNINVATRPSGHIVVSFTLSDTDIEKGFPILQLRRDNFSGTLTLSNMKWELGKVEDPVWTPAPEDIRTERIEKGTYTVVSPETYGETVIITAYDDMYRADREYATKLTFPATAGAVLRDICSTCDISLGSTSFLHDDFVITEPPTGTFREVIGYIAMIACGNARIDTKNRLQIMSYDFSGWDYPENVVANENLIVKSAGPISLTGTAPTQNTNSTSMKTSSSEIALSLLGKKVTISCDYECNILSGTCRLAVLDVWQPIHTFSESENEGHISVTLTINKSASSTSYFDRGCVLYLQGYFSGRVTLKHVKLELGNTETPWIPHYTDDGNPYLLLDEFTAPKIEYSDTVITGIKTIIKGETSDEDTEILSGDDTYVITVENPLIAGQEQTVLSWLQERICGVPFRPFSGDAVSNPLIEFMDLAKVQDRRGNLYNTFVTDVNFGMPGYTTLRNSTPSMARSALNYSSEASKVEQRARQLVEKEKTDRELAIAGLADRLANASGLYITVERQPDGSSIYYMHNKPTLAESDIVWKLTAEAIGISTDGGKTYPYGFTVTGEMITRLLYAEGINADYIDTGAITVRDSNGAIIFSADIDTGTVIISGDSVRIGGKPISQVIDDTLSDAENYADNVLSDYAAGIASDISSLQSQIDGAIESYYYDYAPTLNNYPASEWKTENDRAKHEGDLFYNKSTGYAYRFFKDGSTWKWEPIQDTDIAKALAAAAQAQDTADGKRRHFISKPTPPYDVGDQWTDEGDILTCVVSRTEGSTFVASDWQKLNKYTDDTVANEALEEARRATVLTMILDNEYEGIPTDWEGKYTGALSVQTGVQVLYGHTDVSASCTYTVAKSSGITGSWNASARTYTVTGLTTDTGWVDITAKYVTFSVTKRFSLAKVKGGVPGEDGAPGAPGTPGKDGAPGKDGEPGRTYFIELSSDVLKRGQTDDITPGSVTAKAYYRDGTSATRNAYAGRWIVSTSVDGINFSTAAHKLPYTNLIPTAKTPNNHSTVLDGIGYRDGAYATSVSPYIAAGTGTVCTGAIPFTSDMILYVKGVTFDSNSHSRLLIFTSTGTYAERQISSIPNSGSVSNSSLSVERLDSDYFKITPNVSYFDGSYYGKCGYIVLSAVGTGKNLIVSTSPIEDTNNPVSDKDESSKTYSMGELDNSVTAVRFTLYAAGGTSTPLDMQTLPIVVDIDALTHEDIFNLLTDNGKIQGIFMDAGQLYINGNYIKANTISADKLSVSTLSAITADLGTVTAGIIQSKNYVSGVSGMRLTLATGEWDSPNFKLSSTGVITATGANIAGKVTASSGEIGGWTLTGSKIHAGDASTGVAAVQCPSNNTTWVFAAGGTTHDSYAGCPFRVNKAGELYATKANITGAITATSGSFTGTVTASSGEIGGWEIISDRLRYNSDTRIVSLRAYGGDVLYVGTRASSSATWAYPFRLYEDGSFVATAADIKGKVTATSGAIGGWTLNGTQLYNGTITGNAAGNFGMSTADFTRTVAGASRTGLRLAIGSGFGVSKTGSVYCGALDAQGYLIGGSWGSGVHTTMLNDLGICIVSPMTYSSGRKGWIIGTDNNGNLTATPGMYVQSTNTWTTYDSMAVTLGTWGTAGGGTSRGGGGNPRSPEAFVLD